MRVPDDSRREDVFRLPGFFAFWSAETISAFGTYITTLALQVFVVFSLQGSPTDVGLVNASRWLPYVLFGLVAGAIVDRWRRKPVLVTTDCIRALLLGAIPALWLLGWLNIAVLMTFVGLFGLTTLFNDAASQSYVPRLAPPTSLVPANARLDQGAAAAQTSGPVLAGALIAALGAPLAVLVDAVTYLVSAALIARIPVSEAKPAHRNQPGRLSREIGEGLGWIYRHPTLRPLAISTHGWFVCNSMLTTVFVPFVLVRLQLTAFELGLTLAAAGVAGLLGSLCSTRLGAWWGAGRTVIACRVAMPVGWALIALTPAGADLWTTVAFLSAGQALYGLAMGAENANEMGYWQALTPDPLQGRVNATRRSVNRGMIVVGAPLGGLLADAIGYPPTIWLGITGFALAAAVLAFSPFARARRGEGADLPERSP